MKELLEKMLRLDEIGYSGIQRKQRSITNLFPSFPDRVQAVANRGGVRLEDQRPSYWHFKLHSGTKNGVWYDGYIRFKDTGALLNKLVKDRRLWTQDKTSIDLRKLAKEFLYKADLQLECSCPSFLYYGFSYITSKAKYDAKFGDQEHRRPRIRNPRELGMICKHLHALLQAYPFYINDLASWLKDNWGREIENAEREAKKIASRFAAAGEELSKKKEEVEVEADEEEKKIPALKSEADLAKEGDTNSRLVGEGVETEPDTETEPDVKPKPVRHPLVPVPHQDPEPKGENLDVELFKQRRKNLLEEAINIDPSKEEWIHSGDDEINQLLPKLSTKGRSYLEMISSDSYTDLVAKLERYTGINATNGNTPQLVDIMFKTINKITDIETKNKRKLEQLAVNTILSLDEFEMVKDAIENGHLILKVALKTPTIKLPVGEENIDLYPDEKLNMDLANKLEVSDLALRKRLSTLLIQGGAVLKSFSFHLVESQLEAIDKNLPKLYGIATTIAYLGYWLTPFGMEKVAVKSGAVGGAEQVKPTDKIYTIHAEAILFPFLLHELVKGIYDWFSIKPEFSELRRKGVESETTDLMVGSSVFKTIQKMIPTNKQNLLPLIQKKIISDVNPKLIKEILAGSKEGKAIIQKLLIAAEDEWEEYKRSKDEFTVESRDLVEGIKDLRIQYVDTGKVSNEVFDKLVSSDPSGKGKYTGWMLKQIADGYDRIDHLIDNILLFDEYVRTEKITRKDIYSYKTVDEIEQAVSEASKKISRSEVEREIKGESEVIRDDDTIFIVHVKSHKASCKYGANTKWCTAMKIPDHWERYWKAGNNLYYIVHKPTNKKYAVVVNPNGSKTVYTETDQAISYERFVKMLNL